MLGVPAAVRQHPSAGPAFFVAVVQSAFGRVQLVLSGKLIGKARAACASDLPNETQHRAKEWPKARRRQYRRRRWSCGRGCTGLLLSLPKSVLIEKGAWRYRRSTETQDCETQPSRSSPKLARDRPDISTGTFCRHYRPWQGDLTENQLPAVSRGPAHPACLPFQRARADCECDGRTQFLAAASRELRRCDRRGPVSGQP